jgi:hypothetical protein
LLDNLQLCSGNNYDNLCDAVTIRCAEYDTKKAFYAVKKALKIMPATAEKDMNSKFRYWNNPDHPWTYAGRGKEESNPMGLVADCQLREEKSSRNIRPTPKALIVPSALDNAAVKGWASQLPEPSENADKILVDAEPSQSTVTSTKSLGTSKYCF